MQETKVFTLACTVVISLDACFKSSLFRTTFVGAKCNYRHKLGQA